MQATLYTDDGAYFIRLGNGLVIRWCRAEEEWNKSRADLPGGATQIDFADLPEAPARGGASGFNARRGDARVDGRGE